MIRIAAALLLFGSAAYAQEPDEQTKIDALKVGYALNGNSMVKWGSIDLTSLSKIIPPVIAQEPPKAEIKKRVRESRKRRYRR